MRRRLVRRRIAKRRLVLHRCRLHRACDLSNHHLRRIHSLELKRSRSPLFVLSWTVIHEIDEKSPLFDVDWDKPETTIMLLLATLIGHDGTYGQTIYARQMYQPSQIRIDHRFVDVISELEDGRLMIDYTHFHDTIHDDKATTLSE